MGIFFEKLLGNGHESRSGMLFRSILALGTAALIVLYVKRSWVISPGTEPDSVYAKLLETLPSTDPLLLKRLSAAWRFTAVEAAKDYGEDGLFALEAFGDDAAFFLRKNRSAFGSLAQVEKLGPTQFRLASGPWRRGVLEWAENGKLEQFLHRIKDAPGSTLHLAEQTQ